MRTLNTSLIYSVIGYGVILYGRKTKSYLDKLEVMQHTCLHVINGTYFHPHSRVLEAEHAIVPLSLKAMI
jgi:hypothetical protein